MSAALVVMAGVLALSRHPAAAGILCVAAALLLTAAMRRPDSLRTLNFLWFRLGLALHRIVSPAVLFLVFVAGVIPTALAARVCRLLDFPRHPDARRATYWSPSALGPLHLDRQY